MTATPFIIDCDTGRDDALALWSALAAQLPLSAVITSYGNTALENALDNTARILSLAGRDDIRLFAGAHLPGRTHKFFDDIVLPRQAKSGNGLCDIQLPAPPRTLPAPSSAADMADALRNLAQQKGALEYVILGPATNAAAICDALGSDLRDIISGITMMGGKFDALWDQMPGADFNLACDPYAVDSLLHTGLRMRFVPMNATWPIVMPLTMIENLEPQSIIATAAKNIMIAHCRHFAPEPVFRFHDPSVIIALQHPEYFQSTHLNIQCDASSADFGRLITGPNSAYTEVFMIDDTFRADCLDRLLGYLSLHRG